MEEPIKILATENLLELNWLMEENVLTANTVLELLIQFVETTIGHTLTHVGPIAMELLLLEREPVNNNVNVQITQIWYAVLMEPHLQTNVKQDAPEFKL